MNESISPEGAGILVFVIAFTLLRIFIVPPLVSPQSPRVARPICAVALICSLIVSAFLASLAALHGTADLRPNNDGRFHAEDHGKRTEISAFAHKASNLLTAAFALAAPLLAGCLFALSSLKRNADTRHP